MFKDAEFEQARVPLVRFPAKAVYKVDEIQSRIAVAVSGGPQATVDTAPPICPKCGVKMVVRTTKSGAQVGNQFWGCTNYPQCTHIIPLELG